jgi:hypothetical protein
LTLQQVAERVGYSKQLIGQQETGASEIAAYDIVRLARIYGCSLEWLLIGEAGGTPSISRETPRIPKLTQSQLLTLAGGIGSGMLPRTGPGRELFVRSTFSERVCCISRCSEQALAFDVFDNALQPELKLGDTVIVDGAVEPVASEPVLVVLTATHELLFRRYEPRRGEQILNPPFDLSSTHPLTPSRTVTTEHAPIFLGAAVEFIRVRGKVAPAFSTGLQKSFV